jgi:predicted phosphodiesterase
MRILVISDIHSNIQALSAVLSEEKDIDCVWCAGDLVDYGTSPCQVTDWFISEGAHCRTVTGNHDTHLVNVYHSGESSQVKPAQFKWIHQNCLQLNPHQVSFLQGLPESLTFEQDGWWYLMVHQYDPTATYRTIESTEEFDAFWNANTPEQFRYVPRKRILTGHTHRQAVHCLYGNRQWINPGSISYRRPDESDKNAQYAVIENGMITLRRIPYDRSVQYEAARYYWKNRSMMETEIQDFFFFFGDAKTSRDPLPCPGGKQI